MELTRRGFLKTKAVLAGAVGVGLGAEGKVLNALAASPVPAAQANEKITYNQCPGDSCHSRCIIKCYVRDGKLVKTEAYQYPEEPRQTHACTKGLTAHRWLYAPDRLQYPMKQVGERGSGQWQRVTWEEAFDTIANQIREVKDKYGIEHLMFSFGGSSVVGNLGGRLTAARFANLVGHGGATVNGCTTDGGVPAAMLRIFGDSGIGADSQGFVNSKMLVQWGGNPAEVRQRTMRHILEAKETGTKYIDVGVIFDPTAAMADQFIGIRMATDGTLAMSMINVIVEKGLYEADYVKKYTVGPFLVRSDKDVPARKRCRCGWRQGQVCRLGPGEEGTGRRGRQDAGDRRRGPGAPGHLHRA